MLLYNGATSGWAGLFLSKPVAITVTITSSFKFSLITEPKIVLISVLLTMLAGFIPSKKAAKQDPVIALRNE